MKEIVTARAWDHHTLPEGLPLCPIAQSAMGHIHPLYIGVCCPVTLAADAQFTERRPPCPRTP
jgi:hypothetical protein